MAIEHIRASVSTTSRSDSSDISCLLSHLHDCPLKHFLLFTTIFNISHRSFQRKTSFGRVSLLHPSHSHHTATPETQLLLLLLPTGTGYIRARSPTKAQTRVLRSFVSLELVCTGPPLGRLCKDVLPEDSQLGKDHHSSSVLSLALSVAADDSLRAYIAKRLLQCYAFEYRLPFRILVPVICPLLATTLLLSCHAPAASSPLPISQPPRA